MTQPVLLLVGLALLANPQLQNALTIQPTNLLGSSSPAGSSQFQKSAQVSQQMLAVPLKSSQDPTLLSSREAEKAIVDRILGDGYDKRIRPAGSLTAGKQTANKTGEFVGSTSGRPRIRSGKRATRPNLSSKSHAQFG